jgi:HEAT repeat protein
MASVGGGFVLAQAPDEPEIAEPAEVDLPAPGEAPAPLESPAAAAGEAAPAEAPVDADLPGPQRMEEAFKNYLHFALIGQFELADSFAQALLKLPDLNPITDEAAAQLLELSEKYEGSLDTLLLLISNSPIAENAEKVLALVREAHRRARMRPDRIKENINLLAGAPNQRAFAISRLRESGEYAVPWMLEALIDPARRNLQPFITRALPQLGKPALNPLVEALSLQDEALRRFVAEALGRLSYPQALPYLKRLATDENVSRAVRDAAAAAMQDIILEDPRLRDLPATVLFAELAAQYYQGAESLMADPREDRANVWFARGGTVVPVEVPRSIFSLVMSMRCCEAALALDKDQPAVSALWIAANFRREAELGLDVQTEEEAVGDDGTRPPNFPRSVYFARSAGPDICRIVLSRGVRNRERSVALGAIAALAVTAGPAAMVSPGGSMSTSLVEALAFPDLLVRIKAALAVGKSMPPSGFAGSEDVVGALANALSLTGRQYYVLVEPDDTARQQLETELTRAGGNVAAAARLEDALRQARAFTHVDGIFVASDIERPTVIEAVRALRDDERFSLAPLMVYIKKADNVLANRVNAEDPRVGVVFVVNGEGANPWPQLAEALMGKYPATAARYGHVALTTEASLPLALDAAATLRLIAFRESAVFDIRPAERALIEALGHQSPELRVAVMGVLALMPSPTAQRALATAALDANQTEPLRMTAFAALAESAQRFGHRLEEAATQMLVQQALKEPNLALRTAASQALGAMNLPGPWAATVILAQPVQ